MTSLTSTPGTLRLLGLSIFGQLPLTTFGIILLLQTQHLTGSFATGGMVTGVYAVSVGAGGPLLGQLIDRRGQTLIIIASAATAAIALCTTALLQAHTPAGANRGCAARLRSRRRDRAGGARRRHAPAGIRPRRIRVATAS